MELQKAILSQLGDKRFKKDSRIGKEIFSLGEHKEGHKEESKECVECPTLSDVMEGKDKNPFPGLGTDVWIAPKGSVFDDDKYILKDNWEKDAICFNLFKEADGDNVGISSPESENPFKQGFSCPITIDFEDHLRSACELAKCVMPYGSKLPYFVRYNRFDWDFVEGIGLKKPWRFYNLPRLLVYHFTSAYDDHVYFGVNDVVIGIMTSEEFVHCLSNERWADLMERQR